MTHRSRPMSSKDLQQVTDCMSYIGQPTFRRQLPSHRNHVTQKVRIARTADALYLAETAEPEICWHIALV